MQSSQHVIGLRIAANRCADALAALVVPSCATEIALQVIIHLQPPRLQVRIGLDVWWSADEAPFDLVERKASLVGLQWDEVRFGARLLDAIGDVQTSDVWGDVGQRPPA